MAKPRKQSVKSRIALAAREHFGQDVARITAPGGEGRSSFRLHLTDRTVIATLRPNFRRTHLEAHVLTELAAYCSDLPECLGVVGDIMFQSDVGKRRLNVEIDRVSPDRQVDLAAEAVAAIFRIHAAARRTRLHDMLPHLGSSVEWVTGHVDSIDFLEDLGGISGAFDRFAACERLAWPARQFVKWDCRSGNAAIGADDRLRWFDFEYAGMRHGAEDFAWLIGDEAWPLSAEQMVDIMIDAYDTGTGIPLPEYLDYLAVYLTFHCVQRLKLIVKEAEKRGWKSKDRIRRLDDAGLHPDFAVHLCEVGGYFAERSAITEPLARNFHAAAQGFREMS